MDEVAVFVIVAAIGAVLHYALLGVVVLHAGWDVAQAGWRIVGAKPLFKFVCCVVVVLAWPLFLKRRK